MGNLSEQRRVKLEHFQNLIAVAFADGYLDESEKEFLSEKAEEFGLNQEEVQKIMSNVDNLEFLIPMNAIDKEDQLADVVFMSMIDGEVSGMEYELCLKISEKLDLGKNYLDHVIDLTRKLWSKS